MTTPSAADREAARRARVQAIRNGAITRAAQGVAASYCKLDSGQHQVSVRGRVAVGATLNAAIAQLRELRP